ncbi:hypothetical protein [Proteus sp. ZN5]|uniref:hypothetical protein n=1 Tax=Proteus sp. ZN5 TaxID=2697019 RepID=UPI0013EB8737|nr:hypothetical protein [Proteus sp. ZN5]
MVKKTIHLRSKHFKDLVNKMKKMHAVKNTINPQSENVDLIVINNKIPTLVFVK